MDNHYNVLRFHQRWYCVGLFCYVFAFMLQRHNQQVFQLDWRHILKIITPTARRSDRWQRDGYINIHINTSQVACTLIINCKNWTKPTVDPLIYSSDFWGLKSYLTPRHLPQPQHKVLNLATSRRQGSKKIYPYSQKGLRPLKSGKCKPKPWVSLFMNTSLVVHHCNTPHKHRSHIHSDVPRAPILPHNALPPNSTPSHQTHQIVCDLTRQHYTTL